MLGFKEKRDLHKIIKAQNEILSGSPSFSEKRAAQKTKMDALKRLGIGQDESANSSKIIGKIDGIDNLVDIALSRKSGNKAFTEIGKITAESAAKVKYATGIDVDGFVHSIDEATIRHIIKHHGDANKERDRGQIAVTPDDLKNISQVIENPDEVIDGEVYADGTKTIIYRKNLGDTSIYVQEVKVGRKRLAAKTLWKVPAVPPAIASNATVVPTSETFSAHSPQGNKNIDQSEEKSTDTAPQPTPPDFSEEINRIEALIGHYDFESALDALVEKLETSGIFAQYETRLIDIATRDALAAAGEWA